jgi:hypothetical protein
MTRIGYNSTQWIAEDGRRLLERYLVLDETCRRFSRIPLKLQGQPSLYLRGGDWIAAQHGRIISFTATGRSRDLLPESRFLPCDLAATAGCVTREVSVVINALMIIAGRKKFSELRPAAIFSISDSCYSAVHDEPKNATL